MTSKAVTIVLPYYNRMWGLKKAIENILNQKYPNWHIIVMDDYGQDNAFEFLRAFNDIRISYFRQKTNKGVAENWIDGIKKVSTPYCCILMDDDWYNQDFISSRVSIFEKFPEVGIVYGPYIRINEKNAQAFNVVPKKLGLLDKKELQQRLIARDNFIGATMFKTNVLQSACSKAQKHGLIVDYALLVYSSLLTDCCGFSISDSNFCYREHSDTLSNLKEAEIWDRCHLLLNDLLVEFPHLAVEINREACYQAIYCSRKHGKYISRVRWALRSIGFLPKDFISYKSTLKAIVGFKG